MGRPRKEPERTTAGRLEEAKGTVRNGGRAAKNPVLQPETVKSAPISASLPLVSPASVGPPRTPKPQRAIPHGSCGLFVGVAAIEKIQVFACMSDVGGPWTELVEEIEDPDRFPQTEAEVAKRYGTGAWRLVPKRGRGFACRSRLVVIGEEGPVQGGRVRPGWMGGGQQQAAPPAGVLHMMEANTDRFLRLSAEQAVRAREDAHSQMQFVGAILEKATGNSGDGGPFTAFLQAENTRLHAQVAALSSRLEELKEDAMRHEYSDDPWADIVRGAAPRVLNLVDRALAKGLSSGDQGKEKKALEASPEELLKELPSAEVFARALAAGHELGAVDIARLWKLVRAGKLPESHRGLLAQYLGRWISGPAPLGDAPSGDGVPVSRSDTVGEGDHG